MSLVSCGSTQLHRDGGSADVQLQRCSHLKVKLCDFLTSFTSVMMRNFPRAAALPCPALAADVGSWAAFLAKAQVSPCKRSRV